MKGARWSLQQFTSVDRPTEQLVGFAITILVLQPYNRLPFF